MARIAVIGSGAVGLFYGAQFVLAGHDVRFLLRRDHERIATDGLVVHTTPTDEIASTRDGATLRIPASAFRACRDAAECARDGRPDWVLVALKTTAIDQAPSLLVPLLGDGIGVVAMCNGLGIEERLAQACPADALFGAMAHVCIRRRDDASIHHQAHGRLLLGHLRDDPTRLDRLVDLVDGAGIAFDRCGCLLEARWRKLVWNIPYNGLSVVIGRDGADTAAIMADLRRRTQVETLMREVIAAANADLAAHAAPSRIEADAWVHEMLRRTETMGPYLTSTLLDLRAGAPLEIEAIFGEPVRRAHACGVAVPEMDALLAQVRSRAFRTRDT
jgi:2-dehydropantoate 2-reductase